MPKATPLNAVHRAAGARMVDFGGWDMPVNYGSQIDEHHAVRGDAGMFDVSHMRALDLTGDGARAFLRTALANNVDKLTVPGKALYSCLLRPDGTVLDDLIVYFLREDFFRIVVNAGTTDKDIAWLRDLIAQHAPSLQLTPRPDLAMIAVQGPNARAKVWQAFPGVRAASADMKPFFGASAPTQFGEMFVARTGYTGEDGFELLIPDAAAPALWDALLQLLLTGDFYALLDRLTTAGAAIVMLSTEVEEHVTLMDRVLVFHEADGVYLQSRSGKPLAIASS